MFVAFMLVHNCFYLSVGLELCGFEFKLGLNLKQVCEKRKRYGFLLLSLPLSCFWPEAKAGPACFPLYSSLPYAPQAQAKAHRPLLPSSHARPGLGPLAARYHALSPFPPSRARVQLGFAWPNSPLSPFFLWRLGPACRCPPFFFLGAGIPRWPSSPSSFLL